MRKRRSSAISRRVRTLVITDLDGTLLDHASYSWAGARPALAELRRQRIPLIFCTSKTRLEIHPLRRAMGNSDPFVVENGGLIVIPRRYFPLGNVSRRSLTLRLGQPYQDTVQALRRIARQTGVRVRGFHQMSTFEVAQRTGLTLAKARLAQKRQSGEPFIFQNATPSMIMRFTRLAYKLGYSLQRGGRFWHISGGCDKGLAVNTLIGFYRASGETHIHTIGLGDSGNDLPMLRVVDRPILMPKADGSFDDEVTAALPHILRSKEPGPAGWGRAVLAAIRGRKTIRSSPTPGNAPRREAEAPCGT